MIWDVDWKDIEMKSSQCGSGMSFSRFLMECHSLFEVQSRRKEVLEPHQSDTFSLHQCLCEGLPHFLPRPLQTAIPSFIRMAKTHVSIQRLRDADMRQAGIRAA